MRYSTVLSVLFAVLVFSLVVSPAFSEEGVPQGEIYSIYIDPEHPIVLDDFAINIGVRNKADNDIEYSLDMFIIKDGQVKDESSFTFQLDSDKGILFSPTFAPISVGQYEIVVKLYDKYKSVLYDTEISQIDVVSDIGPFDLIIDVLSRTVMPGDDVPLIVRMKNAGIKGTDVKIDVSMDCINQSSSHKEFFVFLGQKESLDKSLTIKACNEEGLHDVTAKLLLFDTIFVESLNQIFVNRTYFDYEVRTPNIIEIRQGEYEVFDVYIKNTAEVTVHNLKLAIENIPLEWISVNPSTIIKIEPNETAMFIVNVSIPADAPAETYPLVISVGSDETLIKQDSNLKIITGRIPAAEEGVDKPLVISKELQYKLVVLVIVVIVIGALIVSFKRSKSRKFGHSGGMLGELKDIIG